MKVVRILLLAGLVAGQVPGDFEDDEPSFNGLDDAEPPVTKRDIPPPVYAKLKYRDPAAPAKALLADTFQQFSGWQKVSSSKFTGEMTPLERDPSWVEGDKALKMQTDSAHHALVKPLQTKWDPSKGDSLYASMEVAYEQKVECGGAYFKLFSTQATEDHETTSFNENTPYSIMFGPDRCGYMTNKVHLIVKFPHPVTDGELVEEHLKDAPKIPFAAGSHQYGFALHADGTAEVYVDGKAELSGDMKELFKTKFANDELIPDTTDVKPADWVDEVMIPDPDAVKPVEWDEDAPQNIVDEDAIMPEGWLVDEPEMIVNPDAEKPEDWDDEEDGEWSAPMMKNPACYVGCGEWKRPWKPNPDYKGPWKAPMIENPLYQGEWHPRKIPNPSHYDIEKPYSVIQPFDSLGFELWTVQSGAAFDNIIVTTSKSEFDTWIKETFEYKAELEKKNHELKAEYERKLKAEDSDTAEPGTQNGRGFFEKLWLGLQLLAAENKLVFLLTVGIPVATMAYVVNRILRRTTMGIAKAPVAAAEKEQAEPRDRAAPDSRKAETDIPKKEEEKSVLRQRKGAVGGEVGSEAEPVQSAAGGEEQKVAEKEEASKKD